ncbi:hypothetical protein AVEN_29000-1 [Araneus ventricosus]|uniref:Transcriptional coactivator p15 (PC4) C-terminal domain-containing protein n=1 Tax=Araneus ventricosus TaxID=182803 RepID=A0A4Y2AJZ9_ARAVE|nr:hypothetical protein AVEN_29000-1 [Araneus ventricosus]
MGLCCIAARHTTVAAHHTNVRARIASRHTNRAPDHAPITQPATPTSLMPDGYIHLGDDMMLGVAEFLDCLKVNLRHYVVKNNQYIPTRTGIAISPYHWQVLSDSISTLSLESPHACLMIERKLFLSVTDTSVVFQHVFNNSAVE